MNLHRLIAEYRKISRRLRRRALLASARQIQAWKRRLAYLDQRIRLAGGRNLRRVTLASALLVPALGNAAGGFGTYRPDQGAGNGNFLYRLDTKSMLPTYGTSSPSPNIIQWSYMDDDQSAAFADVDGDGDQDAVVMSGFYSGLILRYLRNDGSATVPKFVETPDSENSIVVNSIGGYAQYGYLSVPYSNNYYHKGAFADVDNDGDQDFVLSDYRNMRYFKNEGTRTSPDFHEKSGADNPFYGLETTDTTYFYYMLPSFADLDGDGDQDLVVSGRIWNYGAPGPYGDINGNARAFIHSTSNGKPVFTEMAGSANPFAGIFTSTDYINVALGDLDGDGDADLLWNQDYDDDDYVLHYWENTGSRTSPSFTDRGVIYGNYQYPGKISLVDIDGDGDLDLYAGNYNNDGIYLTENKGSARAFKFSQSFNYNTWMSRDDVPVDLDADGDIDWVNDVYVLRNDGGALYNLGYGASYSNPTYHYGYGSSARAFADIDGDGDMDGLFSQQYCCYSGGVDLMRNDGGMNFSFVGYNNSTSPFYYAQSTFFGYDTDFLQAGDLDGDGDLDVLSVDTSGNRHVLMNQGTPTAPIFYDQSYNSGYDPFYNGGVYLASDSKPFLVDFDHDGDADLVQFPNYDNGGTAVYFRNDSVPGNAHFSQISGAGDPFNGFKVPYTDRYAYAEDLDGDGDIDFLMWNYYGPGWVKVINNLGRFTKVDTLAKDQGKIIAGPVPAKAGQDICLYVDQTTDSVDFELFNFNGERVIAGLNSAVPGSAPCFKADIAPGLYWAKIKSGDRTITQKIIITAK